MNATSPYLNQPTLSERERAAVEALKNLLRVVPEFPPHDPNHYLLADARKALSLYSEATP